MRVYIYIYVYITPPTLEFGVGCGGDIASSAAFGSGPDRRRRPRPRCSRCPTCSRSLLLAASPSRPRARPTAACPQAGGAGFVGGFAAPPPSLAAILGAKKKEKGK